MQTFFDARAQTKGLIGERELGLMKDGAIIINTARAGILDEYAASEALKLGKLSGVGLDVTDVQVIDGFMRVDSPIFEHENVVYTPHQGGSTREASARSHKQWVENVCRVLKGEEPHFIVNGIWPPAR